MQDWLFRLGLCCIFSTLSLTFDKREVLPDVRWWHGVATEVTSCGLTENLFKLMTEVIERVLKTFEVVSTADCFRMPAVCFGSTSFLQTEMSI